MTLDSTVEPSVKTEVIPDERLEKLLDALSTNTKPPQQEFTKTITVQSVPNVPTEEVSELIEEELDVFVNETLFEEISEIYSLVTSSDSPPPSVVKKLCRYLIEFSMRNNKDSTFKENIIRENPFYHDYEEDLLPEIQEEVENEVISEPESENETGNETNYTYIDVEFIPEIIEKVNDKRVKRYMKTKEFNKILFNLDDYFRWDKSKKTEIWTFKHGKCQLIKESSIPVIRIEIIFWKKNQRKGKLPTTVLELYYKEISQFLKENPFKFRNSKGQKGYLLLKLRRNTIL